MASPSPSFSPAPSPDPTGRLVHDQLNVTILVVVGAVVGIVFGLLLFLRVKSIKLTVHHAGAGYGTGAPLLSHDAEGGHAATSHDAGETLLEIYNAVREGADAFLMAEYRICAIFLVLFGILILILVSHVGKVADSSSEWDWAVGGFSMLAFLVGGITSIISGYIGMKVAVFSNARTTVSAIPDGAAGWKGSFNAAFRAGAVTGFMLVGIALLVLYILACLFSLKFNRRKVFPGGPLDPMANAK